MPRLPGNRSARTLRRPRREDLGLGRAEFAALARLTTPAKIQAFLNALPANHELDGETILSVREVLRQRRAHCIEGAFVGACALWVHGEPPLVLHMDCDASDYPHVVALFRRGGHWGALSKTNGAVLRYRDPVYRSLRELTLSLFPRVREPARRQDAARLLGRVRPAAHRCRGLGDVGNRLSRGA